MTKYYKKLTRLLNKSSIIRKLTHQQQLLLAIVVVVIVAATGTYLLTGTHAESPYILATAVQGTYSGGATKVANNGASDGNAIQFDGTSTGGNCPGLANGTAAFCDTFSEGPGSGGREGELNPALWSVTRIGGGSDAQDLMPFPDTPVSACQSNVTAVNPDNDILVCDSQSGHAGQVLVALSAQNYAMTSMRPRQPFDFANRTGTITFDVDAVTQGGLSWWPSVFITDQPTAGADDASQVLGLLPRNGIGIDFTGQQCNNAPPKTEGAVGNVFTYSNYVQTDITNSNAVTSNPCYATRTGSLNHFEVSLSQSQVTVWASDYSTNDGQSYPNFKEVFSAAINLSFSQGYVFFQTAERAPVKYASQFNISPGYANYYWSDLGFDGPVVSTGEKGYSLPDALTVDPNSSNGEIPLNNALNVGYGLLNNPTTIATCCNKGADTDLSSFNIPGVNLNGVNSAYLSFDVDYTYISPGFTTSNVNLHYSLNGGPWLDPDPEPDYVGENTCSNCPGPVGGGEVAYNFPVPLADLINGTNTLNFSVPGSNNGYPPILTSLDLLTFTTSSPP